MRWFKPNLRSSLYALLGQTVPPSEDSLKASMEEIRRAMLELLGEQGLAENPQFVRRVRFASDPQALWYARADLLAVLAARHGEARARDQVEEITRMFNGLLPQSLQARAPSRRR